MQGDGKLHEPQSLLEVREWKRKASDEIERIGFPAYSEKCREKAAAFWADLEVHRKSKPKAAWEI